MDIAEKEFSWLSAVIVGTALRDHEGYSRHEGLANSTAMLNCDEEQHTLSTCAGKHSHQSRDM